MMMGMRCVSTAVLAVALIVPTGAFAHAVAEGDKGYIQEIAGVHLVPFAYLGAKHMVTGYDHLLFLFGVIFYLYRLRQVALYVSLFALGHSTTMILGVMLGWGVNAYLIDAIIGLSVVYKALDNASHTERARRLEAAGQHESGVIPAARGATRNLALPP
jgi:hypothetical protein